MNLVVRTYAGFEDILSEEIIKITGITPKIGKRAVYLEGDLKIIYQLNLYCRLALDVLVELHHYKAKNEDELYKGALKHDWSNEFSIQETFSLNSVVHSPFFNHSKYASLKIKDAIVDQFKKNEGSRPSVDRENPDHRFLIRISHDNVNILWNSSGDSLYKRGYRTITGAAPLNEVLAAGILIFSGWDKKRTLIDPMCGSGTFLCEALMMAKNIAPGLKREIFGFAKHKNYDHKLWLKLKEEAENQIENSNPNLIGYDLLNKMVFATKNNLKNIYPNHSCPISAADFLTLEKSNEDALILMNPPYNVRIPQEKIHDFYANIGSRLKHEWSGSDAWILSGDLESLKHIGLRPKRRIRLFNGPIETKLVHIPLYRGSKKAKKQ